MSQYHEDDEYDDGEDEDSFEDLPPLVLKELDRRTNDPSITSPASDEIVALVRKFFAEGGDAFRHHKYLYMDLMEQLGVTPSTTDPFVKQAEYNIFDVSPANQTQEERRKSSIKLHQDYCSKVRLLRYQEFIDSQTAAGLGFDPLWSAGEENLLSPLAQSYQYDDKDSKTDSTLDDEYQMTPGQLLDLSQWCQGTGFYNYVNHDKIIVGLAVGQTSVTDVGNATRMLTFDVGQDTLLEQIDELFDRYGQMQCPLGPKAQFAKVKINNNKSKKKKSGGLGTHAEEMEKRTKNLILSILNVLAPTSIMAEYVGSVARMLLFACAADKEVARTLIQVTSVLSLRKKALKYAMQADADMKGRPLLAAVMWWQTYDTLTELIGESIRWGTEIDSPRAAGYFLNHVEEALLTSIKSSYAAERYSALRELPKIMSSLQSNSICSRFLKNTKKWQLLEDACAVDAFEDESITRIYTYRQQKRQAIYSTFAAKEAIGFFCAMGKFGMQTEDTNQSFASGVTLGRAAYMLVQKGIVPLLLKIAGSDCRPLSTKALMGLAHLSTVKYCRVLIGQYPHTVKLIHKCLKSSDLQQVSETLLLVIRLLWDKEEAPKLTNLIDPPLQEVAIKWAAFSMRQIIDWAHKLRTEAAEQKGKRTAESVEAIRETLDKTDPISEEKSAQIMEDLKNEKLPNYWLELETDESRENAASAALGRSIAVLSGINGQNPEPLLKVNALHLVSCCIDVPTWDHHLGSATLLCKILLHRGAANIVPDMFPDPEHLIVSLIDRVELCAQDGIQNGQAMNGASGTLMKLTSALVGTPAWRDCLQKVADSDKKRLLSIQTIMTNVFAENLGRRLSGGAAGGEPRDGRFPIHPGCNSLTGKLKICGKCGKLESKAKEFEACSRCRSAYYCGKECQKSHWKMHKKTCKAPQHS